jgi:hypothetical protein
LLQQVTRSGNDWRPFLETLQTTPTAATQAACDRAYNDVKPKIGGYLDEARQVMSTDPTLLRWWGDLETHISDQWGFIDRSFGGIAAGADLSATAKDCLDRLDDAGYSACRVTIPTRLKDTLSTMTVGDCISFDEYFSDEVPNADQRTALLKEWVNHSALVDAYVDADARTIVKVSTSVRRQWFAIVIAIIVAAGCVAALVALRDWKTAPGLPAVAKRPAKSVVIADTILIWIGMVSHIALSGYRRLQTVPHSARRVLSLVSARQVSLWIGVIVGAALSYVFVLGGRVTDGAGAFAIGYASDSIVAQLLPQFDTGLAKLTKALPVPAA